MPFQSQIPERVATIVKYVNMTRDAKNKAGAAELISINLKVRNIMLGAAGVQGNARAAVRGDARAGE